MGEKNAPLKGENFRILVLTPELVRLEYSPEGVFTDEKTQIVQDRDFDVPQFTVRDDPDELQIMTDYLVIHYDRKPFSANGLSIVVRGHGAGDTWHYGDSASTSENLGGAARTLDGADGEIPLEPGLFSRNRGCAVIDDSRSCLILEDGSIAPRPQGEGYKDLYFFGYGHAYEKALRDFYRLTGPVPLVPRFALGNWWSRYHKYTQSEYEALVEKFESEHVPLSVAVIDMDWHLVDIPDKYGSGWTGYTWNEELFPDYRAFLRFLHQHGLKTALNIHPADGIKGHEKQYRDMARAMGRDISKEEPVPFDFTDPKYREAIFKYVYHPYEEEGVDFWWLDWQQGGTSRVPGLDPLWLINHFHYLDNCRPGGAHMTFSRYAGPGSHRYPIGFSGDTYITWESLAFQPYFTIRSSNIGYGWWSHDIGGHMGGYKDEELTVRWVQLGVFSPILRLHSSNLKFIHKEPWAFTATNRDILEDQLRLRHALIPYLYAMDVEAHEGMPLVRPLYLTHPEKAEAYEVRNEFYFGSELLVMPITEKSDATGLATFKGWLPGGGWYDVFTGLRYEGQRRFTFARYTDSIPVLAREGAILPMTDLTGRHYTASTENPAHMEIRVFAGKDGEFVMPESRTNEKGEEIWLRTSFRWIDGPAAYLREMEDTRVRRGRREDPDKYHGVESLLQIVPEGDLSVIPARRSYSFKIYGVKTKPNKIRVNILGHRGRPFMPDYSYDPVRRCLAVSEVELPAGTPLEFSMELGDKRDYPERTAAYDLRPLLRQVVDRAQTDYSVKAALEQLLDEEHSVCEMLSEIVTLEMPERLRTALEEILLSKE